MQERLVCSSGRGTRRFGGNRAGEMRLTRFLRNPSVTPAAMAAEAALPQAERGSGRRILAIPDTSVIKSEGGGGHDLQGCIAVDDQDGAQLGLAHAEVLTRGSGRLACRWRKKRASAGWTGCYGNPGPNVMRPVWFEFQAAKREANAIIAGQNG